MKEMERERERMEEEEEMGRALPNQIMLSVAIEVKTINT